MYKAAVMGDWDSIYGFSALGFDTYRTDDLDTGAASKLLRRLAGQNYAVIYVTEALAAGIREEIQGYNTQPQPAVILIPGIFGNTGEGMAAVHRSVEQAVGSDIL